MLKPLYIIRYSWPDKIIYVEFANYPPLDEEESVKASFRRWADSYLFLVWYTDEGHLWSAEFRLESKFYELLASPPTLREDVRKLASESNIPELAAKDLYWIVRTTHELIEE